MKRIAAHVQFCLYYCSYPVNRTENLQRGIENEWVGVHEEE